MVGVEPVILLAAVYEGDVRPLEAVGQREIEPDIRARGCFAQPFADEGGRRLPVDPQDPVVFCFGDFMGSPNDLYSRCVSGAAFQLSAAQRRQNHFLPGPAFFVEYESGAADNVVPVCHAAQHLHARHLIVADIDKLFNVPVAFRRKSEQQLRILPHLLRRQRAGLFRVGSGRSPRFPRPSGSRRSGTGRGSACPR